MKNRRLVFTIPMSDALLRQVRWGQRHGIAAGAAVADLSGSLSWPWREALSWDPAAVGRIAGDVGCAKYNFVGTSYEDNEARRELLADIVRKWFAAAGIADEDEVCMCQLLDCDAIAVVEHLFEITKLVAEHFDSARGTAVCLTLQRLVAQLWQGNAREAKREFDSLTEIGWWSWSLENYDLACEWLEPTPWRHEKRG